MGGHFSDGTVFGDSPFAGATEADAFDSADDHLARRLGDGVDSGEGQLSGSGPLRMKLKWSGSALEGKRAEGEGDHRIDLISPLLCAAS